MKADTPQLDAATYCEASVAGRFAEVVARGPDRPAIVSDAHTWCYAELDERSTRIASAVAATTEPGARVALRFAETAPLIASMLGVLKAGRVYVILGDSDPPQRRDAIVRDAGAALVIGDRADNAGAIERSLSYREAIESDGDATLPDIAPDDAATIVYTSGSTGAPKRVTHSQRTLLHWFLRYDAAAGLSPDDRFALVTPANYAAATSPIFGALLSGGALVPVDDAAREPRAFADWLRVRRVTVLHTVPAVFRSLSRVDRDAPVLEEMRLVRLGGDRAFAADLERFRSGPYTDACRFMLGLASTETGLIAYSVFDRSSTAGDEQVLPVAHVARDVRLRIENDAGQDAAIGEPGEIVVTSRYLSPDIGVAVDDQPGVRRHRTGDRARRETDGGIRFIGRADRRVKVRGNRVELDAIEAALLTQASIADVAVTAEQRGFRDARLVAYVVPARPGDATMVDWRSEAQKRLPDAWTPGRFVPLRELPRLPNGKVDRSRLTDVAGTDASRHAALRPPRSEFDKRVARLWERTLETWPIGLDDDFHDLGGDSLAAMSVLRRVEELYGVTLPPTALDESPTLGRFTDRVARAIYEPRRNHTPLINLRPGTSDRPIFFLHALDGGLNWARVVINRLALDDAMYGLQSPTGYGQTRPARSIAALASLYARYVRGTATQGRCAIVGYCMGGVVSLELARRLERAGVEVAPLVLIDPPLVRDDSEHGVRALTHRVRDAVRSMRWRTRVRVDRVAGRRSGTIYSQPYRLFAQQLLRRALTRYTLKPAPVRPTVLKARDVRLRDGVDTRERFIASIEPTPQVITVPGDHVTCLNPPHLDTLVDTLRPLLATSPPVPRTTPSET